MSEPPSRLSLRVSTIHLIFHSRCAFAWPRCSFAWHRVPLNGWRYLLVGVVGGGSAVAHLAPGRHLELKSKTSQ